MKKLLLYGLSLPLVFSLAACASKSVPSDAGKDQSQNNEADDLTQAISNVQQSADKELEKRMIGAFYSVYYYSRELNPDKQVSDCLNYELRLLEDDFAFFKACGLEVPSDYEEDYKQWIADGCQTDGFAFYTQKELESEFNRVYSVFSSSDDDLGGELTELRHYCSLLGKLYPTDYVARYIDRRPLDASGNDSTASDGSTDSTPNGGSGNTGSSTGSSGKTDITQLPGYVDPSEFGGKLISEGDSSNVTVSDSPVLSTWG